MGRVLVRLFTHAWVGLIAIAASNAAFPQNADWVGLQNLSSTYFEKLPTVTQQALKPDLEAYKTKWAAARPLVGASGKPLPHQHNYIAPTVAWIDLPVGGRTVALSLLDSGCEGPNSSTASELYICKAVLSIIKQNITENYPVSVCYASQSDGEAKGDQRRNEVSYDKQRDTLNYRVNIPGENLDYCLHDFPLN